MRSEDSAIYVFTRRGLRSARLGLVAKAILELSVKR